MATLRFPAQTESEEIARRVWNARYRRRALWVAIAVPLLLIVYLIATAPISRTLRTGGGEPGITLLSAEGDPIARRGSVVDDPVELDRLPDHVWQAFVAIEDRRFHRHSGIDGRGIARAAWRNLRAGSLVEGGSTITQQLAKQAFLDSRRTIGRKFQEMVLALWIEARLSKAQILERYLSSVYFGDNVYGLRAASNHYFDRDPEDLDVAQSAMLAGLVKAPTQLAPTRDLDAARERSRLVIAAMADTGAIDPGEAERIRPASLRIGDIKDVPANSYFVDWLFATTPELLEESESHRTVETTLERRLQRLAESTVRSAPLGRAQVALVTMRTDGRVVAMVGGRNYSRSAYNRVSQAERQPGSTFKLFVYLAALREGMNPLSPVLDSPITIDGWSPANADRRYRGQMTLIEAFATSSNVAAVRLAEQVGRDDVIQTARELGIDSKLSPQPSLALGTHSTSLLDLTAAFAGIAGNAFPVEPVGLAAGLRAAPPPNSLDQQISTMIHHLLWAAANVGTGRSAALRIPTYGKTGTTQDNRDAIFVGFAGGLVTGVWIGNDDNSPLGDIAGGGLPARIWRDYMASALGTEPLYPAAAFRSGTREPARIVLRGEGPPGKSKGRGKGKRKGRGRR